MKNTNFHHPSGKMAMQEPPMPTKEYTHMILKEKTYHGALGF